MERLRGINFGGWFSQVDAIKEKDPNAFSSIETHMETFLDERDFAQMKKWGFNHVRLPVDSYLFFTNNEDPIEKRFVYLDNAVRWAAENALFLVIDLHECPGHDFANTIEPVQNLFKDPLYLAKTKKIWSILAERFGDARHVIFEVLNEPVAPNSQVWNMIKDELCRCVASHAPKSPVIVGSNMWNWPSTYHELTPIDSDLVTYCFHFYEPLLFTHQYAPWMREPEIKVAREYPQDYGAGFIRKYDLVMSSGFWNRDRIIRELEKVFAFREKYKVQVICNEFGVYAPVPLQYQLAWMDDLLSVCASEQIGFTYWNYKNLDFGIISRGERLHKSLPQYDNPERINYSILAKLQKY